MSLSLNVVLALGFQACRETNGYRKFPDYDFNTDTERTPATKTVLHRLVSEQAEPTSADLKIAEDAVSYFNSMYMMKTLQGGLSDFEQSIVDALAKTEVERVNGFYCFIADMYKREQVKNQVLESANFVSEHVGTVGKRMSLEFTVSTSFYSQRYDIYFTKSILDGNQISFAYKSKLKVGKTYTGKGTVKAHRDNGETQFNRVTLNI